MSIDTDIIDRFRLAAESQLNEKEIDIQLWKNLKHNKSGLESLLQYNIVELNFQKTDGKKDKIICTSNVMLINILRTKKPEQKKKMVKHSSNGISCKDSFSVMTYDISDMKLKTIPLKNWSVSDLITIRTENALILDRCINELLKKA